MAALCVTPEICKAWEKSGKTEFLRLCKGFVVGKSGTVESAGPKDLKRALYELCWNVIRGHLKIELIVSSLQELTDVYGDLPSLLADILSIIDVETTSTEEKHEREKFINVIPAFLNIVPECLLKERLDQETLENAGLISSKSVFQQKYVKTKTKLYYKQQKFNLLREESEGYSKLITELNQDITDGITHITVLESITSLIGCFNLDPNRVLDIILESFEGRSDMTEFFIPLLQNYMSDKSTLCHVLGFKFHFYQQTQDSETPASLYLVAALLLSHGLIEIDAIYHHLCPSDAEIVEKHKKDMIEARNYAKKLTVVILKDESKEKEKEEKETKLDQPTNNQKLGMCEALLQIGDWDHARNIINRLPPFFAVAQPTVAQALCKLVHYVIEPVYAKHSGLPAAVLKARTVPAPSLPLGTLAIQPVPSWEDFRLRAVPLICSLGPHLSCDPILMSKLIRIARTFMNTKSDLNDKELSEDVFRGLMTVMDEVILPSLSLLPSNCCLSEEIWSFVKLLKYEYRYRLYGQWKNDSQTLHPKLIRARADVLDRSKYIMKRLAKENVKPLGRQIGKLSHSNPGVLFEHILSQIQKYDNFIAPVVDSLKFLTQLSYDVMAYCIIEALANPERERLKHDDTNISLWLQSLASFCGAIFKKYPIELAGLLQYVANQLKAGKSYDLLILREVVTKMAGIEVSEEITNDQLEAMSGGELLRAEGGYFQQVRNTKKSSCRLKEGLFEHSLAIPMCTLMAQQRNGIVFTQQEDKRHLKLIGKLYDQCQDTLVQFISFLSLQLSTEELKKRLPPVDELLSTFHVTPDAAFALWRICYTSSINATYDELRKLDKKDKDNKSANSQSHKQARYCEAGDSVMKPIMDIIAPLNQSKVWEDISLPFYTTFWTLTMYDLQVPTASYEKQRDMLKSQLASIEDNRELAQSKKKKEKERCNALIDKLTDEEKKQQDHVKMVMARLKQENEKWFHAKTAKHTAITSVLQMCLFPRCCFTAIDAIYCAKFLYVTHNLKTPNFSSLICYDRIFTDITWTLTSCTESEAHRYGRFLCAVLDDVMRWHSDRSIYEKECANYPGFVTVFRNPAMGQVNTVADQLDYENYRHVVHKWHFSLTKVAVSCLESAEYLQIRNALIILTKVLPHYPRVSKLGQALERRVERVCQEQKEKRPDIYALAMGYSGQLKMKKKTWIMDTEFHNKGQPDANKNNANANVKSNGTSQSKADAAAKDSSSKSSSADKIKDVKPEPTASESKESLRKTKDKDTKPEKIVIKSDIRKEGKSDREAAKDSPQTSRSREIHPEKDSKESKPIKDLKSKEKDAAVKVVKDKKVESKAVKEAKSDVKLAGNGDREREGETRTEREARKAEARKEKEERRREKAEKLAREKDERFIKEERRDRKSYDERPPSTTPSTSHGQRRSAEPSPRHVEDRDVKRRKVESAATSNSKEPSHAYHNDSPRERYSKESIHAGHHMDGREKSYRSPGHEAERERILEKDRERERKERKRVGVKGASAEVDEREVVDTKRTKADQANSGKSKLNGSSDKARRSRSQDRVTEWTKEEESHNSGHKKLIRKDSPDKAERAERRSSDKHPKKSKHR